jgi:hypothetical protein
VVAKVAYERLAMVFKISTPDKQAASAGQATPR